MLHGRGLDVSGGHLDLVVEPVDSPDAQRLLRRYAAEIARRWEGRPVPDAPMVPVEHTLSPPEGLLIVCRVAGRAVACVGLRRLTSESADAVAEVKRMYVEPECRGRGIARRLLAAVESTAAAEGVQRLRLDTRADLVEARALYRSAGYAEIERYNDNPYAAHWLEKTLPPLPPAPGP